jgi:hypothetical protein
MPFLPIFVDSCGQVHVFEREAALFIVLKPGVADATLDNPNRCCRAFTRDWNCNGIRVANLYALLSVDSSVM